MLSTEADERLAAIARSESLHPCEEEGCDEPAVARSLCRRHYARRLYQERKERLGVTGSGSSNRLRMEELLWQRRSRPRRSGRSFVASVLTAWRRPLL